MWRDVVKLHPLGTVPNHIPDHVFRDPVTPRGSVPADCPEDFAARDGRGCQPSVDRVLHPTRHRSGAHATAFSTRSTMAQCPCRIWTAALLRDASSARRSPHPSRMEIMATSRASLI